MAKWQGFELYAHMLVGPPARVGRAAYVHVASARPELRSCHAARPIIGALWGVDSWAWSQRKPSNPTAIIDSVQRRLGLRFSSTMCVAHKAVPSVCICVLGAVQVTVHRAVLADLYVSNSRLSIAYSRCFRLCVHARTPLSLIQFLILCCYSRLWELKPLRLEIWLLCLGGQGAEH